MKKLLSVMVSIFALSSLTACVSNSPSINDIQLEQVNVQAKKKFDHFKNLRASKSHDHTVVYTMYQDPATHNKQMKLQIDFACSEGDKESLNASSSPSSPYTLSITGESGKPQYYDVKDKETLKEMIEFLPELIIKNEADRKVVNILAKDLNDLLKGKSSK